MGYEYAKDTGVSVAKSRAEIEDLIIKYGATAFVSGSMDRDGKTVAAITFVAHGRRVQFELELPDRAAFASFEVKANQWGHTRTVRRSPEQQAKAWEQACRQKWRALALVVKAKLEAVRTEITTFEDEFLAHIVVPGDGRTLGKIMRPALDAAYKSGKPLPPLLGAGS